MALFLWALILTFIGFNMFPVPTIFGALVGLGCAVYQYMDDRRRRLDIEIQVSKLRAEHAMKEVRSCISDIIYNTNMMIYYEKELEKGNHPEWKVKSIKYNIRCHKNSAEASKSDLRKIYYPKLKANKQQFKLKDYNDFIEKHKPYLEEADQQGD